MTASVPNAPAPTSHRLAIGQLSIHYLQWRSADPNPAALPIIALHGLASTAHWYERLAARLSRHYQIFAPDQRGHGQTTQAPAGYDWPTLAADIAGFIAALGLAKVALLGHSWGGNVAINVAARFPQQIAKLVLIDGGFLDGHLLPDATWELFRARYAPRNVSGTRAEFLDRQRSQLADCWDTDLERIVQTMVYADANGQMRDILQPAHHAQVLAAMWDEPPSVTLPQILCPTLIIPAGPRPERAGAEFARTKERMVNAAAAAIPHNQVHWIPETIHDIGYHKPDTLAQTIHSFLQS